MRYRLELTISVGFLMDVVIVAVPVWVRCAVRVLGVLLVRVALLMLGGM